MDIIKKRLEEKEYVSEDYFNVEGKSVYLCKGGKGTGKSATVAQMIAKNVAAGKTFFYCRNSKEQIFTVDSYFTHKWRDEKGKPYNRDFLTEALGAKRTEVYRGKPFANAVSVRYQMENDFIDENGNKVEAEWLEKHIGYAIPLSQSLSGKGAQYPLVDFVILEEYDQIDITQKKKLQLAFNFVNIIDSVVRDFDCKLIALSNSGNGISPIEMACSTMSYAIMYEVYKKVGKNSGVFSEVHPIFRSYLEGGDFNQKKLNLNDYEQILHVRINKQDIYFYRPHFGYTDYVIHSKGNPKLESRDIGMFYRLDEGEFIFENGEIEKLFLQNVHHIKAMIRKKMLKQQELRKRVTK